MRHVTLDVVKKNRVYFKCVNESGHSVKLTITPKTENLEIGKYHFLVTDVSKSTKFGRDVIYDAHDFVGMDKIVVMNTPTRDNKYFRENCDALNGKWDSTENVWVFSKLAADKVKELIILYNSDSVTIEIKAKNDILCKRKKLYFRDEVLLAEFHQRDSRIELAPAVELVIGNLDLAEKKSIRVSCGATFRVRVNSTVIEKCYSSKNWDLKIVNV